MGTLSYKKTGVDIEAGYQVIKSAKALAKKTHIPGVIGEIGSFAGLFRPDWKKYKDPVLVASTDGVGTKLKLAIQADKHKTIGLDLVAMNVDDLLAVGAKPLFLLDYFACHKLNPAQAADILAGIAEGCRQAGCALLGGETAELSDMYYPGDYDLAATAVGLVERSKIVDGKKIKPGCRLVGIASSGIHSNGYTLVRGIVKASRTDILASQPGFAGPFWKTLLEPTRIYARTVWPVMDKYKVHGAAHITGGGLPENVSRALPKGCQAVFKKGSWPVLPVFKWLQAKGRIRDEEMLKTFNLGLGFVLIVAKEDAAKVIAALKEQGERAYDVGEIAAGPTGVKLV